MYPRDWQVSGKEHCRNEWNEIDSLSAPAVYAVSPSSAKRSLLHEVQTTMCLASNVRELASALAMSRRLDYVAGS